MNFILQSIAKMNIKKGFEYAAAIAEKTGKNKLLVACDMALCGLKYGAAPLDYMTFEMYNLPSSSRKTYVTRAINNKMVRKYNDYNYIHFFKSKLEFAEKFRGFLGRQTINLEKASKEEFKEFLKGKKSVIVKPADGTCGVGVEAVNIEVSTDIDVLYNTLRKNRQFAVEERVVQHSEMSRLHPHCVNTARLVTVLTDKGADIIYGFLRIGNGRCVDNFNAQGMASPIDIETGRLKYNASDKAGNIFEFHPITNVKIKDFQLPNFEICKELVKKASAVVPQVGYVGWDVAITEKGAVLIEGNYYPGHDILQMPVYVPDKIGYRPIFDKYL